MAWCLGLDQSIRNTGWAIGKLDNGVLTIERSGVWTTPSKENILVSIDSHVQQLTMVLQSLKIEHFYVEEVYVRPPALWTGIDGSCLLSHMNMTCWKAGHPLARLVPSGTKGTSWRKTLGITTKGKKETGKLLTPIVGRKLVEHEADALAILITGLYHDRLMQRVASAEGLYELLPTGGLQKVPEAVPA